MLTAAVRDLHRTYPNEFLTDVRTGVPDLWTHNPNLTPLEEEAEDVFTLDMHYPLIHRSNQAPYHFIHGYIRYLNEQLGLQIEPTEFKGDIHLSVDERARLPVIQDQLGDRPYWIIGAGGKYDYTIKWWHRRRWQEVVDRLQGEVQFVQVGQKGHYHPRLERALDLRGKTSMRELIRLIHHADGVACGVTVLMHLAAAVPIPEGRKRARACVVVNGGREPPHWEAYPAHQFLHTIGALDCCATGGCWRARTVPLGDGSKLDAPDQICLNVRNNGMAHCMDMISVGRVVEAVRLYLGYNNLSSQHETRE